MNVNPLIQTLSTITNLPVEPDMYEGEASSYIVYTYEDERPVYFGDGRAKHDTAWVSVALYTPKNADYMQLKKLIRDHLEALGFIVTDISSWLEPYAGDYIRRTTFSVTYTEKH